MTADKSHILKEAKCELARRDFFYFCRLLYPKFYKKEREHLITICDTLQAFYENRIIKINGKWEILPEGERVEGKEEVCKKLMINAPPRHGKSFTATNFTKWVLGKDKTTKVITTSYNETLSSRFGRAVRDAIEEVKVEEKKIVYRDIFPETRIKYGDSSYRMWSLKGEHFSYLATSPGGTVTGIGANLGLIDDIIKNKEEAYNDLVLQNHWDWYTDTFLSRLEEGAKQIIVMTRWSTKDLCGRLLDKEPGEWYLLSMKAYDEEKDKMLCSELLSKKSYLDKINKTSQEIVSANYNQQPMDIKGTLYKSFKTYESLPKDDDGNLLFEQIRNYTDTADEGSDYLCSINYGIYNGEAYILDVLYTQEGMEVTEPKTADFLVKGGVNLALIESNNGGKGFARAVLKRIWEKYGTKAVVVKWFHQSKNKKARILSNSAFVQEHIYFPKNWRDKWPKFYEHITSYQRAGKNAHDDGPDALTGVAEFIRPAGTRSKGRVRKIN